jgi:thiol:disulfide interchange protein DsbD
MTKHFLWLLAFCIGTALAAPEDKLLPPDQAFSLTTRVSGNVLEANWRIASGYYLYRDKFRFESLDPSLHFAKPEFPRGKTKNDPYFGASEIYLNNVTVRIPFESTSRAPRVRIIAQGCNEPVGVCYPPITKDITLALTTTTTSPGNLIPAQSTHTNGVTDTARVLGLVDTEDEAEVVPPEKAFLVDAIGLDAHTLNIRFSIADCCYLYRDKLHFSVSAPDGTALATDLRLGSIDLPKSEAITDNYIGRTEVYRRGFDVRLPLLGATPKSDVALNVGYQGCSDKGVTICYEPTVKRFVVSSDVRSLTVGAGQAVDARPAAVAATNALLPRNRNRGVDLLLAMISAFGAGLLLTFTPCVLPMIPIVSSVLVGAEGTRLTKLRGGLLSYTYVLGTALTYAAAGAVAGATGEQLQAYFQNPWAIGLFSGLLVLFALSMFGLYEIHMPQTVQSFLHHHSSRVHHKAKRWVGGEFIGVFVLGIFSALIIGACVAPVVGSVLASAITTQDTVKGAAIMFALANGQGAVLVAIGVSEGLLLPRSGPWMNTVKHIFGVLLVGVAIYLLTPLQEVPVLLLWGAFFIVCGVYLGATQALPKEASGWQYLWKGLGTLLLAWGLLALAGGFLGGRDVLKPLPRNLLTSTPTQVDTSSAVLRLAAPLFERIASMEKLESRLEDARRAGKPVILDYYATWCTDCERMEQSTFRDPAVRSAIRTRFVALQADVTEPSVDSSAMKRRFGVYGPPALIFLRDDGTRAADKPFYGYHSPSELLEMLSRF